jgi:LPXTG-motif cell wall-anchored protein
MNNRVTLILRIGLILAATLLAVTTTAYAAATFGQASWAWTNPGYRFTVPLTALTNPDKSVCLAYSVNGTAQTPGLCTCSGANCPAGADATYTCNIVSNLPNATITWDISSYTANNGCTGKSVVGASGVITTGPTAVTLASFDAATRPASWLPAIGLAFMTGALLLLIRRRAH